MYIETESDLVNRFINHLPKSSEQIILKEISTSYGRPDILIIKFDSGIVENLGLKSNNGNFSKEMSYIMAYLYHRRWIKESTLKAFLNCTKIMLDNIMDNLLNLGLIDIDGNYIKSKPASEILAIKRIWAYEAKLSQWKYAIEQAERHLWFTRETYILLPEVSEDVLRKSIKECKFRDIGLSVFLGNNSVDTCVKSSKRGVVNSPFIWQLNDRVIKGECIGES